MKTASDYLADVRLCELADAGLYGLILSFTAVLPVALLGVLSLPLALSAACCLLCSC
jgi:hypothetical protein